MAECKHCTDAKRESELLELPAKLKNGGTVTVCAYCDTIPETKNQTIIDLAKGA